MNRRKFLQKDDANMQVFEECLELTLRPRQPDPDRDEGYRELWVAAELLVKHLQNTLDLEEKQALQDWLRLTGQTRKLFRYLPHTDNQKIMYQ